MLGAFHVLMSAEDEVIVFLEPLSNLRMVFILNTSFEVGNVDGFIGFIDGSFSSVGQMLADDVNVASRSVMSVINVIGFDEAKNLIRTDFVFHYGDGMFASCDEDLSICRIDVFPAKFCY